MKMLVKYNGHHYYWVDTITMHDEYDYACAILISDSGAAFPTCLDNIEVVDDRYNYAKESQRIIDELKWQSSMLKQQEEISAEISKIMNCRRANL